MANICLSKVIFHGDDLGMNSFKTSFMEVCEKTGGDFKKIKEALGLEADSARGCFGKWTESVHSGKPVLHTFAEQDWNPQYGFLDALAQKYGISYAATSEECDSDCFEIKNDPEGVFFDIQFSLDIWGNGSVGELNKGFPSEEELLAYVSDKYGKVFSSYEEVEDWLYWEQEAGHVRVWERV